MIENNFLQVSFNLLHLSQNDSALPFNLMLSELGVLQDIGKDLHHLINILGKAFSVENGLLSGGVSIKMGSHVFNLQLKVGLGAFSSSLE